MGRLVVKLAVLCAAISLLLNTVHADRAWSATEVLLASIQDARAAKGLPQLRTDNELVIKGTLWAQQMAVSGVINHSTLHDGISQNWKRLGENVGVGGSPEAVVTALLNSPSHYANIVDPGFTHVGVGIAWVGNKVYVAQEFMELFSAPVVTSKPLPPVSTIPPTTKPPIESTPPPSTTTTIPPTTIPPVPVWVPATLPLTAEKKKVERAVEWVKNLVVKLMVKLQNLRHR